MMFKEWRTTAHKLFMRPQFLLAGAVGAAFNSTLQLVQGSSIDIVTTAGIAGFVAFGSGVWIGAWLVIGMRKVTERFLSKWDGLLKELEDVVKELDNAFPESVSKKADEQETSQHLSWRFAVWSCLSFTLLEGVLLLVPVPFLILMLDLGYGITHASWTIIAMLTLFLIMSCFTIQRIGFAVYERVGRQTIRETRNMILILTQTDNVLRQSIHRSQELPRNYVTEALSEWLESGIPFGRTWGNLVPRS